MAVLRSSHVTCKCGCSFPVQLAKAVNPQRMPTHRQAILDGNFHRAICPECHRRFRIESEFLYTDYMRNTFIRVLPQKYSHVWSDASEALDKDMALVPKRLFQNEIAQKLRVVFGLNELREKLLAEDANLDDRMIELLKLLAIYEHPFLIRERKLRIHLDRVSPTHITFIAGYDHNPRQFHVGIPRFVADGVHDRQQQIEDYVRNKHQHSNIFDLQKDHWVSFRRWSTEAPSLAELRTWAKTIEDGNYLDTHSPEFARALQRLPRGTHLQAWAKRALRTVYNYVKRHGPPELEDMIFEIRFGIELEDEWAFNENPNDIDTIWQLLRELPDTNVEGNTSIGEIRIDDGSSGGWYEPDTGDIYVGGQLLANWDSGGALQDFKGTVRHEIGHAVHQNKQTLIDRWLRDRFGWEVFGASYDSDGDVADKEIDKWIGLMGGWRRLTTVQRREIRSYIRECLGKGERWGPPGLPRVPPDHPWMRANFGPRLACYQTAPADDPQGERVPWYENYMNWHSHKYQGRWKSFFLNYYYRQLMVVNVSTLNYINDNLPDNYAAMSPSEFFAELYAVYHDRRDRRYRPKIPSSVKTWLDNNLADF